MLTDLFDCAMNDQSLFRAELHWRVLQQREIAALAFLIRFQWQRLPVVVLAVDGTAFVAVQPSSVASEGDEIRLRFNLGFRDRATGSLPVVIKENATRRFLRIGSRDRQEVRRASRARAKR